MLVIAPLRACRDTWPREIEKWTEFKDLKYVILHGPKKKELLREPAHIYLINPEGIAWLCRQFFNRQLPFDVMTIDELTKFKNSQSTRSKTLRPQSYRIRYRWGLTGSLRPNSMADVFGQQLMLDSGEALGQFITHFRRDYLFKGHDGFNWEVRPGADVEIAERLAKTWFYMDPRDYVQLPPLIEDRIEITLDAKSQSAYNSMRDKLVAQLPGGVITAENAGSCYSKLAQMANGAVYDGERNVHNIHDAKLDALEELLDELDGAPLFLCYEFNHDLEKIRARFASRLPRGELPYLGRGTKAADERRWIDAWNRNELPLFCVHPASAGHALNLQEGFCSHICAFSLLWDWELFDQFVRRVRRSGNEAQRIFLHLLLVKGSLDVLKLKSLVAKETGQAELIRNLNEAIMREPSQLPSLAGIQALEFGVNQMTDKLPRGPGDQAPPAQAGWGQQPIPTTQAPPAAQQGWGQQQAPQQAPQGQPPAGWGQQPAQQPAPPPAQPPQQGWGQQPAQQPQQQPPQQGWGQQQPPQQQQPQGWQGTPPTADPNFSQQTGISPEQQRQAAEQMIAPQQQPGLPGFSPEIAAQQQQIINGDYSGAPEPQPNITASPENREPPAASGGWGQAPAPAAGQGGWQQPPAAVDVSKMTVKDMEAHMDANGISKPGDWKDRKADQKRDWLSAFLEGKVVDSVEAAAQSAENSVVGALSTIRLELLKLAVHLHLSSSGVPTDPASVIQTAKQMEDHLNS